MTSDSPPPGFHELGLTPPILEALSAVGYESPSPIQARTIPALLSGSDVLGQAQTGTGKTAAFALPLLVRLDLKRLAPQALVLVPTRELAIQVSEAFQKYAARLSGFHVLPIYGGQSYTPQLKGLKRGAHVIVGTPGRVMDHMNSGAMSLADLRFLVLDEGDEMLQMGFVDDIEWILEKTPPQRQIALFSATMPAAIRRIAQKHMRSPVEITIQNRAGTMPKIRQRYWLVSGMHKLDALTRVLEVTRFDAMLIFVRTKVETVELAERLEARGFGAAALNGDIPQQQRERTVAKLKEGQLDIVVATDVAARGLDVERISHVVNYDIPYDSETYVHRIGRTGRAGRSGEAILFVAPRERNMLRVIERVTKQRLEPMTLPSVADVNEQRVLKFKERVAAAVRSGQGRVFEDLLRQIEREQNVPAIEIAASLAGLLQGSTPFLLPQGKSQHDPSLANGARSPDAVSELARRSPDAVSEPPRRRPDAASEPPPWRPAAASDPTPRTPHTASEPPPWRPAAASEPPPRTPDAASEPPPRRPAAASDPIPRTPDTASKPAPEPSSKGQSGRGADQNPAREQAGRHSHGRRPAMDSYRIEVGHAHGVQPGNIVSVVTKEAGLDMRHIGHIDIRDDHTLIDLPKGMPLEVLRDLKKVRVRGAELRISRVGSKPPPSERGVRARRDFGPKTAHKGRGPSRSARKQRRALLKS